MSEPHADSIKVVLLGDTAVGKTSLAVRFVHHEFRPYMEATIGACFLSKTIPDGRILKIWDTAGAEKYHSLAPLYYRGASAAILVYDITKTRSFEVLQMWVRELQSHGPQEIVLCVCGNKLDLQAEHRAVPEEEARKYASEIGAAVYMETSAQSGENVLELFQELADRIPRIERPPRPTGTLNLQEEISWKQRCCGSL